MPHPGLKVSRDAKFNGMLSDMEKEFKEILEVLVPSVLDPKNLVTKKINGHRVTARQFVDVFKSYFDIYSKDELPEPKSVLAATAAVNNLSAVDEGKAEYSRLLQETYDAKMTTLTVSLLEAEHKRIKTIVMATFTERIKLGGTKLSYPYRAKLEEWILERFNQLKFELRATAVDEGRSEYSRLLQETYDANKTTLTVPLLEAEHERIKQIVMATFTKRTKQLRGSKLSDPYKAKLKKGLLKRLNQLKNVLAREAESTNRIAVDESMQEFMELMKDACDGNIMFNSYAALKNEMQRVKTIVINNFLAKPTVGGLELAVAYRLKLEQEINDHYLQCKTMLIAKASSQSREALNDAKAEYVNLMEMVCGPDLPTLTIPDLYAKHQRMKMKATDSYYQRPIMFRQDLSGASDLNRDIDEKYKQYLERKSSKRESGMTLVNRILWNDKVVTRSPK